MIKFGNIILEGNDISQLDNIKPNNSWINKYGYQIIQDINNIPNVYHHGEDITLTVKHIAAVIEIWIVEHQERAYTLCYMLDVHNEIDKYKGNEEIDGIHIVKGILSHPQWERIVQYIILDHQLEIGLKSLKKIMSNERYD